MFPPSPFSIASLTETFTILMNTPMVSPPESDAEVPLTDMPVRRHAGALRAHFNGASMDSESASSTDVSARNSFDVGQAPIFQIKEFAEHNTPLASGMPTASHTALSAMIVSSRISPSFPSSTLPVLDAAPIEAEVVERYAEPSHSQLSSQESDLVV